ncbi:hypothetical protein [Salipiger abyssi]|uniref:Uncharacterized protein n=1 Tax=Salipiger abyssi TaxID=1250539 RepID=A0A1P8UUT3_9RHOB|nr:hypothetical protein [Salipiger abyssi]APZ53149.1 hypothetical protein Ga0080574_TMP2815 [Salipiger abyssi]
MKIDFDQPITNLDGTPLVMFPPVLDADGSEVRPAVEATLGRYVGHIVNTTREAESSSLERGKLAMRIYGGGEVEVTAEELTLMRRIVTNNGMPCNAVYIAHNLLEV